MSSSLRILVAGIVAVAFGVTTLQADEEKPAKEKPEAVKKEGEKPAKEQPAKEKPEAVKKDGEKPTKEQPAKEKPETAKKQPEKPTKQKPAPEKKPEKPVEKKPQAKTDAKQGTLIEAVVKNVDADKNAITVVLRKNEEKVEQTFAVEKDARYLVGGNKAASLSDVKPEMRVALMLTEQKTVAGIRSGEGGRKGQSANGIVKAVDEGKNSITITVSKEGETADQTFAVAKDAKIAVAGGEGKISDLKPGTQVAFMVAEDKKAVIAIKAVAKGEKAPEKKKESSPKK